MTEAFKAIDNAFRLVDDRHSANGKRIWISDTEVQIIELPDGRFQVEVEDAIGSELLVFKTLTEAKDCAIDFVIRDLNYQKDILDEQIKTATSMQLLYKKRKEQMQKDRLIRKVAASRHPWADESL